MVKLLLVIVAVLAVTVNRTDGAITLRNTKIKVPSGRKIGFNCTVTGESFVAWVTPAKPAAGIPSQSIPASQTSGRRSISVSVNTYRLTILNVTVNDGGDYICEGSVNKAIFTLEVNFSTENVKAKQQLHLGRPGSIKLDVSSYPLPTYQWRKDGQVLSFPAQGKTLDRNTGSININNVQLRDEGNYTCRITLGVHEDVEIGVTVIDEPKIRKYQGEPVYLRLTLGGNVTFHCDVISGTPKPEVTWWFGWTDTMKPVDVQYDSRYSHPTDETWTITGIKAQDKGKYRCRAKNIAGEAYLKFEITHVDVPPTIDPMSDKIANDGDGVELECVAAGTPTPTVKWYYEGSVYNPQTNFTRGNKQVAKISFPNVHLANTGKYTCQTENGALDRNGQVIVAKKTMNLYVRSPPKINKEASPTPVYSFVGNRNPVEVTCTFYGYPVPTVIMADENGTEIARRNSSVTKRFETTTESDFGMYNCSAQSPDGNAQYMVELRKVEKPSEILNFQAVATCSSVTLTWESPKDDGGMPINKYVLNYTSNYKDITRDIHANNTSYTINDLKQNTTYNITLRATNKAEWGLTSSMEIKTTEYCGTGKPLITNTEIEVDTAFAVTWSAPPNNTDDNSTRYRLEWREKPITNVTKVKKAENINETRFRISGLEHNVEYVVKLYAVYRHGYSEPDVRTFRTKPKVGKPREILNFRAEATCSNVTLTWELPKDDGGMPINKYILNCASDYKDITRDIHPNNTSYTINDLKQNNTYNITLRATNKAEWGPASYVEIKTTEYCVPGRPIIYSPSFTVMTADSFTMKWRRPAETGGDDDITYTVRYRIEKGQNRVAWIMKTITTKQPQLKITELENNVQYKFEVIAKNKGGESLPDERYIQTNFTGGSSSQSRLMSNAFLTILVGGMSLLLS